MGVCLLPLLTAQVVVDARYLKSFQVKGGYGFWSDAIYDLAYFRSRESGQEFPSDGMGIQHPARSADKRAHSISKILLRKEKS